MPVSITFRHVPDSTRDILASRAAETGRSLQEYLVKELQRLANEPSVDDWIASARDFATRNAPAGGKHILPDLNADRR